MSSRLRSLDSKISFFAFADIITAVSGVLIFVALLLATDLGVPTNNKKTSTNPDTEQRMQEILAQQAEVDAQNERLQELLATANTSPDPDKLQTDIKRLKAQLAREQQSQTALLQQMTQSQAAIAKRDAELGLTALKAQIEKENAKIKEIADEEAVVRSDTETVEQHIAGLRSKLIQLRQREGKLWLIPEQGTGTKEPVLALVSGQGLSLERFDQPDKTKEIDSAMARHDFEEFLKTLKPADEYVVFLIRPSGIILFQDLVKTAREMNIDVGYDAIEENKDVYFASPPVLDETVPVHPPPGYSTGSGGHSGSTSGGGTGSAGQGGNQNPATLPVASGGSPGSGGTPTGFNAGGAGGLPSAGNPGGNNGAAGGGVNGTGSAAASGSGTGTGSSGSETGNGSGNGKSESAKTNDVNGSTNNIPSTTNAPASEFKKDAPKTNSVPAPKPSTPPAKSWWRRFLDWLFSFFK
ncbi:MAG TPA: hypothetical protein VK742_15030 [Candidatus Sulfotelmatobacter sp.]|jgi:hypothetical protein|nr:hypothetical protein [Candidatus Sulfotelmatobacter sp.]